MKRTAELQIAIREKEREVASLLATSEAASARAEKDRTDASLIAAEDAIGDYGVARRDLNELQRELKDAGVDRWLLKAPTAPSPLASIDTRWGDHVANEIRAQGLDLKAITVGGFTLPPVLDPGTLRLGARVNFVRQLLPMNSLDGTDRYSFLRQTVRTNEAAPVGIGEIKPTSVYTLERVEDSVRVIGHVSEPVDRSLLQDVSLLAQFLNAEMRLGLLLAEDDQFLNGDGVAPDLTGILQTAGIGTHPLAAESRWDAILKAITTVEASYFRADAIVMHPVDWESTVLERTAVGEFFVPGAPIDVAEQKIWGRSVLVTQAIAQGTALVGAFAQGAALYEREAPVVTFSDQHSDLYIRNQQIYRCEERVGLAVYRPSAFCKVTGL